MDRLDMKRTLRNLAKPVKKDLFNEIDFTQEELDLMKFLYIDKINQGWVSDELGISIPTLTLWHNNCIEQIISFYNYELYKLNHNQENCFEKYFLNT